MSKKNYDSLLTAQLTID